MTCELCTTNAGRYNMSERCCQLRYLVQMPKAKKIAYIANHKRIHGSEEAKSLVDEMNEFKLKFGAKEVAA